MSYAKSFSLSDMIHCCGLWMEYHFFINIIFEIIIKVWHWKWYWVMKFLLIEKANILFVVDGKFAELIKIKLIYVCLLDLLVKYQIVLEWELANYLCEKLETLFRLSYNLERSLTFFDHLSKPWEWGNSFNKLSYTWLCEYLWS